MPDSSSGFKKSRKVGKMISDDFDVNKNINQVTIVQPVGGITIINPTTGIEVPVSTSNWNVVVTSRIFR